MEALHSPLQGFRLGNCSLPLTGTPGAHQAPTWRARHEPPQGHPRVRLALRRDQRRIVLGGFACRDMARQLDCRTLAARAGVNRPDSSLPECLSR